MSRAVFPLRMPTKLKEAIRDRAKVENCTQTNLIREAIRLYLLTDNKQHVLQIKSEIFKLHAPENSTNGDFSSWKIIY